MQTAGCIAWVCPLLTLFLYQHPFLVRALTFLVKRVGSFGKKVFQCLVWQAEGSQGPAPDSISVFLGAPGRHTCMCKVLCQRTPCMPRRPHLPLRQALDRAGKVLMSTPRVGRMR